MAFVWVGSVERICVAEMFVGCPLRTVGIKLICCSTSIMLNQSEEPTERMCNAFDFSQWQLTATTSFDIAVRQRNVCS